MRDTISEEAKALSSRGAHLGGRARAERLTPAERSEIARVAAQKRWGTTSVLASHTGQIVIGDRAINCAVLEDGTRLINQETFLAALGRARKAKGGTGGRSSDVPPFLSAANLRPFISADLRRLATPIPFTLPNGGRSIGYQAEIINAVCDVYLEARKEGVLLASQRPAAQAAELLVRGLAYVGIVALIDEATGFQETRARDELQLILEAYVQAELRPWLKTFPDEFFREIYRLQGWEYRPGTSKRTPYVGKLVNKYIYDQLPPGVRTDLERKNPRNENGYRAHKHFQFLTEGTGNVHLDRQISTVTTLMRIARSKEEFEEMFDRAFPGSQPRLPLVVPVGTANEPIP